MHAILLMVCFLLFGAGVVAVAATALSSQISRREEAERERLFVDEVRLMAEGGRGSHNLPRWLTEKDL